MHKRLAALPSRQAAEHRRGGGREMVSIPWVEGRTGGSAGAPGVAASRKVRARELQSRTGSAERRRNVPQRQLSQRTPDSRRQCRVRDISQHGACRTAKVVHERSCLNRRRRSTAWCRPALPTTPATCRYTLTRSCGLTRRRSSGSAALRSRSMPPVWRDSVLRLRQASAGTFPRRKTRERPCCRRSFCPASPRARPRGSSTACSPASRPRESAAALSPPTGPRPRVAGASC